MLAKSFLIIAFGLLCIANTGLCQRDLGMPFSVCIHAAEQAKTFSEDRADQLTFLRGFREGVEIGVTNDDLVSVYLKSENETARVQGIKKGIKSVTRGSADFHSVSLDELGYSLVDWRKGRFGHPHEGGLHYRFSDSEENMLALFSTFAWNNWKTVRTKTEPEYSGEFWVKGWISPEGQYGHMGHTKRKIFIIEVYQQSTDKKPEK